MSAAEDRAWRRRQIQQVVGLVLGTIAVLLPATFEWQIPGAVRWLTLLLVAAAGGAVAGRILVPLHERLLAGVVAMAAGALAAIGAFLLLSWWISNRSSVYFVEFLLVILIGSLPGVLLGKRLYERLRRHPEAIPFAVARR